MTCGQERARKYNVAISVFCPAVFFVQIFFCFLRAVFRAIFFFRLVLLTPRPNVPCSQAECSSNASFCTRAACHTYSIEPRETLRRFSISGQLLPLSSSHQRNGCACFQCSLNLGKQAKKISTKKQK